MASSTPASAANRDDISWFNNALSLRASAAIASAGDSRRHYASRSFYIMWDPSVPWMETRNQSADFLAYFERFKQEQKADDPPPAWSDSMKNVYEEGLQAHG